MPAPLRKITEEIVSDGATVGQIIYNRPRPALPPRCTVMSAIDTMEYWGASGVGVEDKGKLIGLFTRTDFIQRVLKKSLDPTKITLAKVMTANPVTIGVNETPEKAYEKMNALKVRHLPVVSQGVFCGMITDEDIGKNIYRTYSSISEEYSIMLSYINGESYGRCGY